MNPKSLLLISALALALPGCQGSESTAKSDQPLLPPVVSKDTGVQKRTVTVDNGFSPSSLDVKVGQPVEITFDTKNRSCATEVIFQDFAIKEPLTDGKNSVVKITPAKAGTYAFACPMNMLTGKVIAK